MPDLESTISEAAQGPAKASGDSGSVEMHPIPDLIEADKYLVQKTASTKKGFGLRFAKLQPPGTV
jgi:hypothetical protein